MGNLSKDMDPMRNNQIEMLEIKKKKPPSKKDFQWF